MKNNTEFTPLSLKDKFTYLLIFACKLIVMALFLYFFYYLILDFILVLSLDGYIFTYMEAQPRYFYIIFKPFFLIFILIKDKLDDYPEGWKSVKQKRAKIVLGCKIWGYIWLLACFMRGFLVWIFSFTFSPNCLILLALNFSVINAIMPSLIWEYIPLYLCGDLVNFIFTSINLETTSIGEILRYEIRKDPSLYNKLENTLMASLSRLDIFNELTPRAPALQATEGALRPDKGFNPNLQLNDTQRKIFVSFCRMCYGKYHGVYLIEKILGESNIGDIKYKNFNLISGESAYFQPKDEITTVYLKQTVTEDVAIPFKKAKVRLQSLLFEYGLNEDNCLVTFDLKRERGNPCIKEFKIWGKSDIDSHQDNLDFWLKHNDFIYCRVKNLDNFKYTRPTIDLEHHRLGYVPPLHARLYNDYPPVKEEIKLRRFIPAEAGRGNFNIEFHLGGEVIELPDFLTPKLKVFENNKDSLFRSRIHCYSLTDFFKVNNPFRGDLYYAEHLSKRFILNDIGFRYATQSLLDDENSYNVIMWFIKKDWPRLIEDSSESESLAVSSVSPLSPEKGTGTKRKFNEGGSSDLGAGEIVLTINKKKKILPSVSVPAVNVEGFASSREGNSSPLNRDSPPISPSFFLPPFTPSVNQNLGESFAESSTQAALRGEEVRIQEAFSELPYSDLSDTEDNFVPRPRASSISSNNEIVGKGKGVSKR